MGCYQMFLAGKQLCKIMISLNLFSWNFRAEIAGLISSDDVYVVLLIL